MASIDYKEIVDLKDLAEELDTTHVLLLCLAMPTPPIVDVDLLTIQTLPTHQQLVCKHNSRARLDNPPCNEKSAPMRNHLLKTLVVQLINPLVKVTS